MRSTKKPRRFGPYAAGLIIGYVSSVIFAVLAAFLLYITDSAEAMSGTAAVIITAIAAFLTGRSAGKRRRRDGLATGAACALLYFLPMLLISIVTGAFGGVLMWVRLILCIVFGAAGGVAGVNSSDVA